MSKWAHGVCNLLSVMRTSWPLCSNVSSAVWFKRQKGEEHLWVKCSLVGWPVVVFFCTWDYKRLNINLKAQPAVCKPNQNGLPASCLLVPSVSPVSILSTLLRHRTFQAQPSVKVTHSLTENSISEVILLGIECGADTLWLISLLLQLQPPLLLLLTLGHVHLPSWSQGG